MAKTCKFEKKKLESHYQLEIRSISMQAVHGKF